MPAGPDHDVAAKVASYIAQGYGKFDDRGLVERTGKGKIYYVLPGAGRSPTIILYEVTSPEDISQMQALAAGALQAVPDAKDVHLHFFDTQNLNIGPNGGASRGWESAFLKVRVTRPQVGKGGA